MKTAILLSLFLSLSFASVRSHRPLGLNLRKGCKLPPVTEIFLHTSRVQPPIHGESRAQANGDGLAAFCGSSTGRCCPGVSQDQVETEVKHRYVNQLQYQLRASTLRSAMFIIQDWQSEIFHKIINKITFPKSLGTHSHLVKKTAKGFCNFPVELGASCGNIRLLRERVEEFLSRLYVKIVLATNASHVKELQSASRQCVVENFAKKFMQSSLGQRLVNSLTCATDTLVCEPATILEGFSAAEHLLQTVSRTEPTQDCLRGLARLWHCPYCSGNVKAGVPPCSNLCLNVIRGCLGHIDRLSNSMYNPMMTMLRERLEWLNRTQEVFVARAAKSISHFILAAHRSLQDSVIPRRLDQIQFMCGLFKDNAEPFGLRMETSCPHLSSFMVFPSLSSVLHNVPKMMANRFLTLDLEMASELCLPESSETQCHNGQTNSSYTKELFINFPGVPLTANPEVRQPPPDTQYQADIAMFDMAIQYLRFPEYRQSRFRPSFVDEDGTGGPIRPVVETRGSGGDIIMDDEDSPLASGSGSGAHAVSAPQPTERPLPVCNSFPDYSHPEPTEHAPTATPKPAKPTVNTRKQRPLTTSATSESTRRTTEAQTKHATTHVVTEKPARYTRPITTQALATTQANMAKTSAEPAVITSHERQEPRTRLSPTQNINLKERSSGFLPAMSFPLLIVSVVLACLT